MRLAVPYIRQPRDMGWCGAAAAAMVLRYYGVSITQRQVAREARITTRGITSGRLGCYFIRKGFDATVQFWLPGLEPRLCGLCGGAESQLVMKALEQGARQRTHGYVGIMCRDMLTFVRSGGTVFFAPVLFRTLINELSRKRPVILEVDANWVDAAGRRPAGHLVVVTGFASLPRRDKTLWPTISAHDPATRAFRNYDFDELLYACHIWYGSALFVRSRCA